MQTKKIKIQFKKIKQTVIELGGGGGDCCCGGGGGVGSVGGHDAGALVALVVPAVVVAADSGCSSIGIKRPSK